MWLFVFTFFPGTVCAPPALAHGKLSSQCVLICYPSIQLIVLVTATLVLKRNVYWKLWTQIGLRRTSYVPRLSFCMAVFKHSYYSCECLQLKCEKWFLNKLSVLLCERSAFDNPSVIMKWEKWDTMDCSGRNLVGPHPLPLDPQQKQGIPLRFAPEAPKLKKTWVKKSGPIQDYFKDFPLQLAQQFINTQLNKLTSKIHLRVVSGVDA